MTTKNIIKKKYFYMLSLDIQLLEEGIISTCYNWTLPLACWSLWNRHWELRYASDTDIALSYSDK